MLLLKNNFRIILPILLVFSNFWIFRIFQLNFFVGVVVAVAAFLTCYLWDKKNSFLTISVITLALLLVQFLTTEMKSLTILENDEQRVQQERIMSYPPTYIDLYFKVIWLKPAKWIEENKNFIAYTRLEKNFFENLDINKYFYAGFPRNTPADYNKFIFFLFPFFLIGCLNLISKKSARQLLIIFLFPIILLTFIGNENKFGPIALFPFFIIAFYEGVNSILNKRKGTGI